MGAIRKARKTKAQIDREARLRAAKRRLAAAQEAVRKAEEKYEEGRKRRAAREEIRSRLEWLTAPPWKHNN